MARSGCEDIVDAASSRECLTSPEPPLRPSRAVSTSQTRPRRIRLASVRSTARVVDARATNVDPSPAEGGSSRIALRAGRKEPGKRRQGQFGTGMVVSPPSLRLASRRKALALRFRRNTIAGCRLAAPCFAANRSYRPSGQSWSAELAGQRAERSRIRAVYGHVSPITSPRSKLRRCTLPDEVRRD